MTGNDHESPLFASLDNFGPQGLGPVLVTGQVDDGECFAGHDDDLLLQHENRL